MLAKSLGKNTKLRVLGIQFNSFGDAGYPITQQLASHLYIALRWLSRYYIRFVLIVHCDVPKQDSESA
jgi:hypothetical protein